MKHRGSTEYTVATVAIPSELKLEYEMWEGKHLKVSKKISDMQYFRFRHFNLIADFT